MSLSENLFWILTAIAIILPIWWIVSAYNRRVVEIEKLREDVDKLKEELSKHDRQGK